MYQVGELQAVFFCSLQAGCLQSCHREAFGPLWLNAHLFLWWLHLSLLHDFMNFVIHSSFWFTILNIFFCSFAFGDHLPWVFVWGLVFYSCFWWCGFCWGFFLGLFWFAFCSWRYNKKWMCNCPTHAVNTPLLQNIFESLVLMETSVTKGIKYLHPTFIFFSFPSCQLHLPSQ